MKNTTIFNLPIYILIYFLITSLSYAQEFYTIDASGKSPDAFVWTPQSDVEFRGPMVISNNLADFSTKSYPEESDPTMFWGYNHMLGGLEIVPGEGAVYWGIEGNYRYNPGKPALMEAYVHFVEPWSTIGHRPIMIRFDKGAGEVSSLDFSSGHQNLGTINFYGQASGGNSFKNASFKAREWTMFAGDGSGDLNLELKAPGNNNHSRIWLGSRNINRAAKIEANNNTHLYIGWNSTATSPLHLRRKPGDNGDITVLGVGGNQNSAVLGVTQVNAADDTPAFIATPKETTSVDLIRLNTSEGNKAITFDTERPEQPAVVIYDNSEGVTPRYKLHKNGYIAVRESGNTSIDRIPTTGTTKISPSWTNKPGGSPTGEPKWFPILDSQGNLYWIPGFPD